MDQSHQFQMPRPPGDGDAQADLGSGHPAGLSADGASAAGGIAPAAARSHSLSGRIRRRARLDAILVMLATVAAAYLGHTTGESMMGATAALSLGVLFYVIRRDRDLSRFARHERWRDLALEGKGVTLAQWKAGLPLEPWPRRETGPDRDQA